MIGILIGCGIVIIFFAIYLAIRLLIIEIKYRRWSKYQKAYYARRLDFYKESRNCSDTRREEIRKEMHQLDNEFQMRLYKTLR